MGVYRVPGNVCNDTAYAAVTVHFDALGMVGAPIMGKHVKPVFGIRVF